MTIRVTVPGVAAAALLSSPTASVAQDPLPEGAGKELVAALCDSCHQATTVVARRRAFDDWRDHDRGNGQPGRRRDG